MLNLDFVQDCTSAFCMSTFTDESGCGYVHVACILQYTWYCKDDFRLEHAKDFHWLKQSEVHLFMSWFSYTF